MKENIFFNRPLSHQVNFIGHILSISAGFTFALAVVVKMSERDGDNLSTKDIPSSSSSYDLFVRPPI